MKAVHSGPFPQGPPRPTVPRVANEAMPPKEHSMIKHALFARLEARPGKEEQVAAFLQAGLRMAQEETTTPIWFALRLSPTTFAVFDAFHDAQGVQAHLEGP